MNRLLFSSLLGTMLLLFSSSVYSKSDRVEVVYFHGAQRCPTCKAIEMHSREVVESYFAKDVRRGRVVFRVVDISDAESSKLAKSYRVTWSSLFVNGWKGSKEYRSNLTRFAFQHARTKPLEFKKGLRDKISSLLRR